MTIKIRKGGFYRTRDGRRVGPMLRWSNNDPYDWQVESGTPTFGHLLWRDDGSCDSIGGKDVDLVAEWVDEPASGVSGFTADELQRVSDAVIDNVTQKLYGDDPNRVTKRSVLETAIQTVADRGVPYGGVEDNFNRIARLWTSHLFNRFDVNEGGMVEIAMLDASDVAMMMALMKIARLQANPSHADSWVDVAGYAACGGEIGAKLTLDKSEWTKYV